MYMFTSRGLIPREVFSLLTDIPEDMSDNRDESNIDADDNFIPAADETSSSSEDEFKTEQVLCDADGVVICLYFCVFQLALIFLCKVKVTEIQPRAVCKVIWKLMRAMVQCLLQRMALNGRKYKSVTSPRADLQVAISWGSFQALQVTDVETYSVEVLQAPGVYYWEA